MKALWPFAYRFWRYRTRLLAGLLCIPLGQAADVAMTVTIGNAIKRAAESDNADWIGRVIWLLTGYAVAQAVFRYFQRWWIVVVSREVEVDLKQDTFEKLTGLSFEFHNRSRVLSARVAPL